jgi:phosphoribosylformylglycinamidine cyclo-ligase
MAINDLITVGATPLVVQAYWAAGGSDWFGDASAPRPWWPAGRPPATPAAWPGAAARRRRWPASSKPAASTWPPVLHRPGQPQGAAERWATSWGRRRHRAAGLQRHPRQRPEPGAQAGGAAATGLPDRGGARPGLRRSPAGAHGAVLAGDRGAVGGRHHAALRANITGHGWRKLLRHPKTLAYRITPCRRCRRCCSSSSSRPARRRGGLRHAQHGRGLCAVRARRRRRPHVAVAHAWAYRPGWPGRVEAGAKQLVIEPLGVHFGDEACSCADHGGPAVAYNRP